MPRRGVTAFGGYSPPPEGWTAQPDGGVAGEAARAVLAALANPALTLASEHVGAAYATVGGLTTYLLPPGAGLPISPYYAATAYAKNTGWGDFLAAYHTSVG